MMPPDAAGDPNQFYRWAAIDAGLSGTGALMAHRLRGAATAGQRWKFRNAKSNILNLKNIKDSSKLANLKGGRAMSHLDQAGGRVHRFLGRQVGTLPGAGRLHTRSTAAAQYRIDLQNQQFKALAAEKRAAELAGGHAMKGSRRGLMKTVGKTVGKRVMPVLGDLAFAEIEAQEAIKAGASATQARGHEYSGAAGSVGGFAGGAYAGAGIGAALMAWSGPGAAIGAALGGLIGGVAGSLAGEQVGEGIYRGATGYKNPTKQREEDMASMQNFQRTANESLSLMRQRQQESRDRRSGARGAASVTVPLNIQVKGETIASRNVTLPLDKALSPARQAPEPPTERTPKADFE
jgi:hypothetical protein